MCLYQKVIVSNNYVLHVFVCFIFEFAGVMKMSLGEKATLNIGSEYGYGAEGAGGVIPPNADLVFVVELLAIGDKAADIPQEGGCCIIL